DGCFKCLGEPFSVKAMSEVLRAIFGYKIIGRAPGQSRTLKRFIHGRDLRFAYLDQEKFACLWPTSMAVQ
ncbi:hypothetical protein K438DRAFT_1515407, partial [Mycena galopus ATCC 62051]